MTPDQAALMDKARASLDAARWLVQGGFHDFAAARAYYAMFYAAQALLLGRALSFSRHSAVIAAFGREFSKSGQVPPDFHRYLIEGQDSRNVADYDATPGLTGEDAAEQIRRAEAFMALAHQLLGSSGREGQKPE